MTHTIPHLSEARLTRMVETALTYKQTKPTAKIIPFCQPLPYIGRLGGLATATAATVLMMLLWQPTTPKMVNLSSSANVDGFIMDYTMLELLEGAS